MNKSSYRFVSTIMTYFKKIFKFYKEGFKNMPMYGKQLWLIIFIKAFIMFAVLKIFFFKDHLNQFETDEEKSEYVSKQLINIKHE